MNIKTVIITLTVFILGGFTGFFISGRMTKHRIQEVHRIANHLPKGEIQHLMRMLDLSEQQKEEIRPILKSRIPKQRELRKRHREQMDSLRKEMFKEITPLLDEEQKERLEHMRERHEREFTRIHIRKRKEL